MSHILNIETSTSVCSVALSSQGEIVFDRVSFEGPSHAKLAGLYVEEALAFANKHHLKPDAVAVSSGPGSYTGLRIGVSLAKGLCFGLDIPLISISTLELMASTAIRLQQEADMLYCPMIDARRMEVYAALYDNQLREVRAIRPDIVDASTYADYLQQGKVCFFGNGAAKCETVIDSPDAVFLDNIHPLASEMATLATKAFERKDFADVAYYEPFYLKDFQATTPKNKVLG